MSGRLASDAEVAAWHADGWVLLHGLVGLEDIDVGAADLGTLFPTPEEYHADPIAATEKWLGRPRQAPEIFTWPPTGPGFRPEQHRWLAKFPFPGSGALNRLSTHPSIVDFAERALKSLDIRIYQIGISAKYTGLTNYEQPMHTDRNHSWLPPVPESPWWHMESFLYLSDVDETSAPTHLVSVRDSVGRATTAPLYMPQQDPGLYAAERAAVGVRGSLLAYRPDVFHRAVDLTAPGGSRFLYNASYKVAGTDWIGYDSIQSRCNDPQWHSYVEGSTPRELELFGFPPPGHAIWTAALIDATADLYPKLDVTPWRAALDDA
jgi:hypothetical protein